MKKHKFSDTHVDIHHDGSATIRHIHESDPSQNVEHAVPDLDGIHDSFEEHLNPEKIEAEIAASGRDPEELEEKVHPGIHDAISRLAGKE